MRVMAYSVRRFEREALTAAFADGVHDLHVTDAPLNAATAAAAGGFDAVSIFVSDRADATTLGRLHAGGVRALVLRSAGFNHVDTAAAGALGLALARVPEYSPHAVAEHAVGLLLCLNRKLHRAYNRVREANFSLDGLVGFDLVGKTVGVIGTGRIGRVFADIMRGFGCRVSAYDRRPAADAPFAYVPLERLYAESDVISLHVPLTPETRHLIDDAVFAAMKPGAVLVNTGRGALVDTPALIRALKGGRLGGAALDVYEEEENVFFNDLSDRVLDDDVLARLLTFPNVVLTAHQAFLTHEALFAIAHTTRANIDALAAGREPPGTLPARTTG